MSAPALTLIEGGDPALVAEALGRVVDALVGGEDRALAVEDHGGEELDLAAIADGCATPPFLVSRRVVVIRDIGRFSTEELAPLLAYLDNPLETTALVLVAGGGPTAPRLSALAKAKGTVVSTSVDSRRPADWVRDRVGKSSLHLDARAVQAISEHLGEEPGRLVGMLDVLEAAFGPGARLGVDDIEPYLGRAGGVTPWSFTDSIDSGDARAALGKLHRLMEGGGRHPLVVLAILHRHVAGLMKVDSPSIRTEAQAAEAMGIAAGRSTFPAKKALQSAGRWGSAGIAEAIGLIAEAELDLKGRSGAPPEAVMEVLVARLCRLAGSGGRGPAPKRPAPAGRR